MSDLGRLATELFVWHTWEFGFVEVADALAGTSSIMPQKKNPHALERVKALGGQAAGWLASMMGCQRTVLSTDLDFAFGDDILTPMGDACARLAAADGRGDRHAHRAPRRHGRASAGAFWSTTSHLADELVRRFDLPFRAAHQIVGRFVRDSIARRAHAGDRRPALLAARAREAGRPEVALSAAELREALDATHFVCRRASEGSVNPRHVFEHIAQLTEVVDEHEAWHREASERVAGAIGGLVDRARQLAGAA